MTLCCLEGRTDDSVCRCASLCSWADSDEDDSGALPATVVLSALEPSHTFGAVGVLAVGCSGVS